MKEIDHELKKIENADLGAGKKSPASPKDAGSPKPAEPTEEDEAKLERERGLRTEKDEIESELAKLESAKKAAEMAAKGNLQEEYPLPVKSESRVNSLLYGPATKCGVPKLAEAICKQRRKGLINFADILEWLKMNGKSNLAEAAEKNLADKEGELQNALAEYEK